MINLLLGAPGGGKGYEACVFHILAALEKGRKVITNMPLDLDRWRDLDPSYPSLLELRTKALPRGGTWDPVCEAGAFVVGQLDDEDEVQGGQAPGFVASGFMRRFTKPKPRIAGRPFGGVWCYRSDWRHPKSGIGPLFVIDEAHLCLPKIGTDPEVAEWFSLHRHFNSDVLLMTQSYGKIAQDVRDLVQIVYRVRKNVALGSTGSYTRKVQDGLRGEVVGESIRRYDKRYYGLWRSHTQGIAASESNASDVRPIWRHWSFIGAAICFLGVGVFVATGNFRAPWSTAPRAPGPVESSSVQAPSLPDPVRSVSSQPMVTGSSDDPGSRYEPAVDQSHSPSQGFSIGGPVLDQEGRPDPLASHGIHLVGTVDSAAGRRYLLVISQSGQPLTTITDADLSEAGYIWEGKGRCAAFVRWGSGAARSITCDSPTVGALQATKSAVPGV